MEDAGVAAPPEPWLAELLPVRVEGREDELLDSDPDFLFRRREIAFGFGESADPASASVISSSSSAPPEAASALGSSACCHASHSSSTCDSDKDCLLSKCALSVSNAKAQCAWVAISCAALLQTIW